MSSSFSKLTPHNYATWKENVWSRLMKKGLNLFANGTIPIPSGPDVDPKETIAWKVEDSKAFGIIRESVTKDLLFHIIPLSSSQEGWDKLESLYGKVDEGKGFTIQAKLLKLDPKIFDTIQDFINKANELRVQLKDCSITIKDSQLIHHMMDNLPSEYAAFVSSYNTHKLTMGSAFTTPSFESFGEMLMLEQSKLMSMGILKSSNSKALVANQGNQGKKKQNKWKHKTQIEKEKSTSSP